MVGAIEPPVECNGISQQIVAQSFSGSWLVLAMSSTAIPSCGLGRHKGIALLVIPLRATGDSFGAYHCGCREEALRVARSR